MAAPDQVVEHGTLTVPVLMQRRLRKSLSGLDEGSLKYKSPSENYFTVGAASAEFPSLYIQEIDEALSCGRYDVDLRVRGLATGSSRRTGLRKNKNALGWDDFTESIIVLQSATIPVYGSSLAGYPNIRLMSVADDDQLDGRWLVQQRSYRGIESEGLVARSIAVNESISSHDSIIITLPGGWDDARAGSISLPRITVTDVFKSTSPPDTDIIPGRKTPPNPPPVKVFPVEGDALVNQWPNKWKLASMAPEELYRGAKLWLISYTYEYVWPETF